MSNLPAQLRALSPDAASAVPVALGSGLVAAAVAVSASYSRARSDLDWSNFVVGVLATLGLLGVAVAARLTDPESEERASLVSWPGAFGAVSAGVMLGVLVNDDKGTVYAGAALVVVLAAAGFVLVRRAPFVLAVLGGLAALFAQAFSDIFDTGGDGENTFMAVGLGILFFVVAATALGWLLPETRELTGVVVGVAGLAAMASDLAAVSFARAITYAFSTEMDGDISTQTVPAFEDPFTNDVWVVLGCCAVLAILWAGAALLTGQVGFRILLAADAIVVVPLSTLALRAEHPTWWGVVPAAIGGAVLVLAALRLRRRPAEPVVVPYGDASPGAVGGQVSP